MYSSLLRRLPQSKVHAHQRHDDHQRPDREPWPPPLRLVVLEGHGLLRGNVGSKGRRVKREVEINRFEIFVLLKVRRVFRIFAAWYGSWHIEIWGDVS